ncbi:MAG: hypothetical protein GX654_20260 [Desulfatiglans sp.]|jgi:hypothetical protein|nr:hypothetical protein [Desulfatiglans sp.]
MKRKMLVLVVFLFAGTLYASGYDAIKGSFSMYNPTVENVILDKIQSQTDPETGLVKIGALALKFDFLANALEEVDGLAVAAVHFSDNEDRYILDYHVDENSVAKIVLVTKNKKIINKVLYPEYDGSDKENKGSK